MRQNGNNQGFPLSASSYIPSSNSLKFQSPGCISWIADNGIQINSSSSSQPDLDADCSSSSRLENEKSNVVNEEDLEYLYKLVEEKDGGPAWIHMMERSTSTMSYQAWRRDLESGPPQYRSRTVFEDATPEMVRDFFWDDEYRSYHKNHCRPVDTQVSVLL
ncbi:uncharacterized protein [Euphorbia lathyris]|uniref:uncharacterized protein n=1 Tax=Euphorbia lathyris TaxID=212925 RepID=UPI003313CE93